MCVCVCALENTTTTGEYHNHRCRDGTVLQCHYKMLQCSTLQCTAVTHKPQHTTENFQIFNIPDLSKSRNVWKPKPRGVRPTWTAQAGRVERNLRVFIFTSHRALLDPLGAEVSSPPPL